jgi:hypothetical protein
VFFTFLHLKTKKTKRKEKHNASREIVEIEKEEKDVVVQGVV